MDLGARRLVHWRRKSLTPTSGPIVEVVVVIVVVVVVVHLFVAVVVAVVVHFVIVAIVSPADGPD